MRRALAFFIIILGLGATLRAQSDTASRRQALLARAKALELSTPYAERAKVAKPVIDRAHKAVHIMLPNGVMRTAKYFGDQGCVTLPVGKDSVNFTPTKVMSQLPDPSTEPWPMGDVLPRDPLPKEIDTATVKHAIDAAFEPD